MRQLSLISFLIVLVFLTSCELFRSTQPIPKDKEAFIGTWKSRSGYSIIIKATGTATVTQLSNPSDPDFKALNQKVAPQVINDIRVEFDGDSVLRIIKPLNYAKEFQINRRPFLDGDATKMILDGVTLIRQR